MNLHHLVIPFGIATFSSLALTVATGLSVRRKPSLYGWHKGLGLLTLVLAICHVVVILSS